jgi:hypothetical protein
VQPEPQQATFQPAFCQCGTGPSDRTAVDAESTGCAAPYQRSPHARLLRHLPTHES